MFCFFFSKKGPHITTLHQVTVEIISDFECKRACVGYDGITDHVICATDPNGANGAFQVTGS
jgi:hypothetical protein